MSIAEDGSIDTLKRGLDDILSDYGVDDFLFYLFCEDAVKGEVEIGRCACAFEIGDSECSLVELFDAAAGALYLRFEFTEGTHTDEDLYVVASLVHLRLYLLRRLTGCEKKNIQHQHTGFIGQEVYSYLSGNESGVLK